MCKNQTFRLFVMSVIFSIMTDSEAQTRRLIQPFPEEVVRVVSDSDGDLRATYTKGEDAVTIKVTTRNNRPPEGGWGGICIENRTPVNLGIFTHAQAVVQSSARVIMDIKLEKHKYSEGTLLLVDHGVVGRGNTKPLTWDLRESSEVGSGTLSQTKRMCFFVLAENFPAGKSEVTVMVSGIKFDRR